MPPHVTRSDIADPTEGSGEGKVCSLVDSTEVLTLRKCVFDVCVCTFCFMFVLGLVLWIRLKKGFSFMRRVLKMCIWL